MSDAVNGLDVLSHQRGTEESIEAAIETQDRIRAKTADWSGAAEIRKWRDERHSF